MVKTSSDVKKLSLHGETVRRLSQVDLAAISGGMLPRTRRESCNSFCGPRCA